MYTDRTENNRHILAVAYLYPPVENTGTRRIVKFVKYLPEFGYRPVVLTTGTRGALLDDAQRLIFRADDVTGVLKRAYRAVKLKNVPPEQRANIGLLGPASRIERWKSTLLVPDPEILWYPLAVRQGRRVLRSLPIRAIYSTSSPETNHLVALKLKQATGLPWIADFRDGWMFEPLRPIRLTSSLRQRLESTLERTVVLAADRIITVNEIIAEDLARRYPEAAAKTSVITNGYDPEDFAHIRRQARSNGKLRLVHTGSFSLSRAGTSITGLLEALQHMRATDADLLNKLEIVLVGSLTSDEHSTIERSGVQDCFVIAGQMPYAQALQHQADADVLLLISAPGSIGVSTSKLFEYLATGRPILALSGRSAASDIIQSIGCGTVVAPDDVNAIQTAIRNIYAEWKTGTLRTHIDDRVRQFDRRELTKKLAALFDDIM